MSDAVPHQLIGERATPYELGNWSTAVAFRLAF